MTFHSGSDVQRKFIRLKLIDGTQINGQIDLSSSPGFDRVSDIISNESDTFLTLEQVTIYGTDFQTREKYRVLHINKAHILWVEPEKSRD